MTAKTDEMVRVAELPDQVASLVYAMTWLLEAPTARTPRTNALRVLQEVE